VSAFAFGGIPARAVEDVVARHDLLFSRALLTEYRAVPAELLARRKITAVQWRALVAGIAAVVAVGRVVIAAAAGSAKRTTTVQPAFQPTSTSLKRLLAR